MKFVFSACACVLGIDPGGQVSGLALVDLRGTLLHWSAVPSSLLVGRLMMLLRGSRALKRVVSETAPRECLPLLHQIREAVLRESACELEFLSAPRAREIFGIPPTLHQPGTKQGRKRKETKRDVRFHVSDATGLVLQGDAASHKADAYVVACAGVIEPEPFQALIPGLSDVPISSLPNGTPLDLRTRLAKAPADEPPEVERELTGGRRRAA